MGRVGWRRRVGLILLFVIVSHAAKSTNSPKTEKIHTEKAAEPTVNMISNMETMDYVRSGSLLVGMLAVNLAGRETWLLAEVICNFAFGVAAFFFPDALLKYETEGNLDAVHLLLAQCMGCMMIGLAITVYISRESKDRSVIGSILMSRLLGGAVLLQAQFIDHFKAKGDKQRWSDAHLTFEVFGTALWVLGALYQYVRAPAYGSGGINIKDRLTKHLLFDLLICFPAGLYMFAFPDHDLSNVSMKNFVADGIHAHQVRAVGAVLFMTALHCHSAMGFSDDIDKRAHLLGRLVSQALYIPTLALYQYKYALCPMNFFYFGLAVQIIVTLNPLCAYYIRGKAKQN